MRINHNIMAMNTHRQYGINNANVAKSVEKLSSGYRINRAGDDAAGLAISEKMRAQIRGLQMASKNSQDAISLVQTAEGALQESHNILQRMRELAVQSASDTNETTIDRGALEQEFQQLLKELDDTANKTRFNDQNLIDGTFSANGISSIKSSTLLENASAILSSKTGAGSYKAELAYTASTQTVQGGNAPETFSSTLGGSGAIAAFLLTRAADSTSGASVAAAADDVLTFDSVEQGVDGNMNQFKLTFTVTNDKGDATDSVTIIAEYDGAGGLTTLAGPMGYSLAVTEQQISGEDATLDQMATALNNLVGKSVTAAGTTAVDFVTGDLSVTYDSTAAETLLGSTMTDMYNGVYTISAEVTAGTDLATDGKLNLKVTDAFGNVVSTSALDVKALGAKGGTISIDLGQYGTIDLEALTGNVDVNMLQRALNGQTISITGGVEPDVVGDPASAKISVDGGKQIDVKVGMSQYTDAESGITFRFDHALTAEDFASEATLQKAIFGSQSSTATVKVESQVGKNLVIQTGANEGDNLSINIDKMDSVALDISASSIATREYASKAITEVNNALNKVSTQRAALGALQNRMEHKIANLDTSAENLQAAEGRIRDLDMAKEMTEFTKNNILSQASTAMLAQANSLPQGVLQLLG